MVVVLDKNGMYGLQRNLYVRVNIIKYQVNTGDLHIKVSTYLQQV